MKLIGLKPTKEKEPIKKDEGIKVIEHNGTIAISFPSPTQFVYLDITNAKSLAIAIMRKAVDVEEKEVQNAG